MNSKFFKSIKLLNENFGCYIGIIKNDNNLGNIIISKNIKDVSIWDVTIINDEITLFSNGYYLSYSENNCVSVNRYMMSWDLSVMEDGYVKIRKGERIINLEVNENGNYVINLKNINDITNSIFKMIDV